jgi:hypothetical protein
MLLNVVLLLALFELWTCLWMPGSAWKSAWSCTGLSSWRTDPNPLRLRPLTRRRNSRQNSDVSKCRPFTFSVWTCSWMPGSAWRWLESPLAPTPTRRRNNQQNSDIFKCCPFICSAWTCWGICGSKWSCTGLFSQRTDQKPIQLRPLTRRRNNWQNSDVLNVVLLLALPDRAGEYVALREELLGPVQYWALLSEDWPETPPAPPRDTETEEQQRF